MNTFHSALKKLICIEESSGNFDTQLENNIHEAIEFLNLHGTLKLSKPELPFSNSIRWKFIAVTFDILLSLKNDENLISINYINDVKIAFQFIVSLGILPNLIPGIGMNIEKRCKSVHKIPSEVISIPEQYYRLSEITKLLLECLEIQELRNFIITNHLNDLLASLLQLGYAPLTKPSNESNDATDFKMTDDFYNKIISDREFYQYKLNKLFEELYTPQLLQELMFFYGNNSSPKWLKSFVYKI